MNLCPSKHPEGSENTDFRSSKQKSLSNGFIKELRRTKGNVCSYNWLPWELEVILAEGIFN